MCIASIVARETPASRAATVAGGADVKGNFTVAETYNDGGAGAAIAFLLIVLPILLILIFAGYIIGSFLLMKIFEKAGVQGKWRAWVPVYNSMILAKLGDVSPWVMLGAIVAASVLGQVPIIGWLLSLVALAVAVMVGWRVGLKLGHEWYLLLLWLIPGLGTLIWLAILAFGQSRWNSAVAPAPWAGNSFLADRTVWEGVPAQASAGGVSAPPASPGYAAGGSAPTSAPSAAAYPPPAAPQPPAAPPAPPAGTTDAGASDDPNSPRV